ncbi:alcohol dehydrogenase family protein [Halobellus sp. EA9]|uniref:alcohol dehydrogenase family protein n=1 Tax=Halobellus sp. EA9 TaxID=3421647 RepID=UPI003EBD587D
MPLESMNAVLLTGHGDLSNLKYRTDVRIPQPDTDEVLIRVKACGLNNTDIWTRKAAYGTDDEGWKGDLEFPRIQGADIAGTIVSIGSEVPDSRIDDKVLVDNALYGDTDNEFQALVNADLIGSERDGGYAEYVAVPAENAHRIDSSLSFAELATFPTSYVTAERMLNRAGVGADDEILVTGASGGVGTGLVQLAARRGARVIGMTTAEKMEAVRELGADTTIARDEKRFTAAIDTWTEDGLDVVADVVGGGIFQKLIETLRPGGRLVTAGAVAGPSTEIDLRTVYLNQIDIYGSTMGTQSEFEDLIRYIENEEIDPVLADTYPLSEIRDAQRRFSQNDYVGSIVVIP